MTALKTSEFWTTMLGAVLGVLVSYGIFPQEFVQPAQAFAGMLLTYAFGRVVSKAAKGQMPYTHKEPQSEKITSNPPATPPVAS